MGAIVDAVSRLEHFVIDNTTFIGASALDALRDAKQLRELALRTCRGLTDAAVVRSVGGMPALRYLTAFMSPGVTPALVDGLRDVDAAEGRLGFLGLTATFPRITAT